MRGVEAFVQLGAAVERAWHAIDYDERRFPKIAVQHLQAADLRARVTPTDILRWSLETRPLPPQADRAARFGDPPITVYAGRRFNINVLFWVDSTTAVHQHGFSGAFQVLHGSSIQTSYVFDTERVVTEAFHIGSLRPQGSRFLPTGSIEPIHSRSQLIHSLFHLERPSVSVVVRTLSEQTAQPQFLYAAPHIAIDPFFTEDWSDLQLRVAKHLIRSGHEAAEALLGAAAADADAHTLFRMLSAVQSHGSPALTTKIAERARERHGSLIDKFLATLRESSRIEYIASRRAQVTSPEHRFFLALLLNIGNRDDILRVTRNYARGEDPVSLVIRWVRELSGITAKLQVGGAAWEPNLLGLPEVGPTFFETLDTVLRDGPIDEHSADGRTLETLRRSRAFGPLFNRAAERARAASDVNDDQSRRSS